MGNALKGLRSYLATISRGVVKEHKRVEELLSACWSELIWDDREVLAFRVPAVLQKIEWNPPRLTFEMKQSPASIDDGTWTIDIDSGRVTTPSDVLLEKILKTQPAKDLIITEGIHRRILKHCLRRIAEAPFERSYDRRRELDRAKSLADRCLSLAKDIQDADEPPDLIRPENYAEWRALPILLAHFARMWKLAHRRPPANPIAPIPAFINFVKAATGRDHYSQIADLINAINRIPQYRHRDSVLSARDLAQMMYRDRKKFNAYGVGEGASKYSDILWLAAGIRPPKNQ